MNNSPETRILNEKPNLRFEGEGEEKKAYVEGYALLFEHESRNLGGWTEIISRDAFKEADTSNVVARIHHKDEYIIGRNKSGTLTLTFDDKGLFYSVLLGDSTAARDLKDMLERGDIDESSFAFDIDWANDGYKRIDRSDENKIPLYRLEKAKTLYDVAPVVNAAYSNTVTGVSKRNKEFVEENEKRLQVEANNKITEEQEKQRKIRQNNRQKKANAYVCIAGVENKKGQASP